MSKIKCFLKRVYFTFNVVISKVFQSILKRLYRVVQNFNKVVELELLGLFFEESQQILNQLIFRQRNSHFFIYALLCELVPIQHYLTLSEFI